MPRIFIAHIKSHKQNNNIEWAIKLKYMECNAIISFCSYLIKPSPFSAQKTFERHNSRRKSNISLVDTRRRSATTTFTNRPPPLHTAPKSTSLSLPDSPQISPGLYFPIGKKIIALKIVKNRSRDVHVLMLKKTGVFRDELHWISPRRMCGGAGNHTLSM